MTTATKMVAHSLPKQSMAQALAYGRLNREKASEYVCTQFQCERRWKTLAETTNFCPRCGNKNFIRCTKSTHPIGRG